MRLSKRNHYNPCFWTAWWCPEYLNAKLTGHATGLNVRNQRVWVLTLKTGHIRQDKVENVHYDKKIAAAEITYEAAKGVAERLGRLKEFVESSTPGDYPVVLDFEHTLAGLETKTIYRTLLDVIQRGDIGSLEEKCFIAGFVYFQMLRGHGVMNAMLEVNERSGRERFEYFVRLKQHLGDARSQREILAPLVLSDWTLYQVDRDAFPLSDSAVCVLPRHTLVPLSPRLLLEIRQEPGMRCQTWSTRQGISDEKLEEFRCRLIRNTYREIIFGDKTVLEEWAATAEFLARQVEMAKTASYKNDLKSTAEAILWSINDWKNQQPPRG